MLEIIILLIGVIVISILIGIAAILNEMLEVIKDGNSRSNSSFTPTTKIDNDLESRN